MQWEDPLLFFKLIHAQCDNRNIELTVLPTKNIRNIILHKMTKKRRKLSGEAFKIFFIYDQTRLAFLICVLLFMFTSNLTWNWCIFNMHVHIKDKVLYQK